MKDILSDIIAHKREEVERQKQAVPPELLHRGVEQLSAGAQGASVPRRSMRQALAQSPSGIIAEFKRRSPSKGWIRQDAHPEEVVPAYVRAGASALSILTDRHFFGGTLEDIRAVRRLVDVPILRKEFIIDAYQLYEARLAGADAVLLIAAALTPEQCHILEAQAHALGLEVLLEIHSEAELPYITPETDMVGVNNRNLGSFVTDVQNSFRLAEKLPQGAVWVSESGLKDTAVITELSKAGFRGFLIGEALMRTAQPGEELKRWVTALQSKSLNDNH